VAGTPVMPPLARGWVRTSEEPPPPPRLPPPAALAQESSSAPRPRHHRTDPLQERRRIARDLHDGLQGRLVALAVQAGRIVSDSGAPDTPERAEALRAGMLDAVDELRGLVHGVMPALLTERGLCAATVDLVDRLPVPTRLALVLTDAGIEVAAAAANAPELIALAADHEPDLVIADIRMPPRNGDDGLRAALAIRAARPQTAIVILSQHVNRQYARQLTESGTARVGYLLKQRVADTPTFIRDIERVVGGATALDPEVVDAMLTRAQHRDDAIAQLTPRQTEVLSLVAQGRTNASIARQLVITEKAVIQHVSRIYGQLALPHSDDDHRRVLAAIQYLTN
jgi:DNA-binding NarL/FixJ family response regulator